jgi:invasion protein IalB
MTLADRGPVAAQEGEVAPVPAPAQQPAAKWAVPCDGQAGAIDCRVVQTLLVKGTRQLLMSVTVRKPKDAESAAMMFHLPHGIYLPAGIRVKIDDGKAGDHPVQTCDQRGCYVGMTLPPALLGEMKKGSKMVVGMQDLSKRPMDVTVGLEGFAEAFKKLN